ncbi:HDOD domain-containing protein [Litorivivens sp.]|uniref:HDOD domain-containing protein n=1 Tax=Litorivivens sp. TaxID=2020868 RepID=UPI00356767E4
MDIGVSTAERRVLEQLRVTATGLPTLPGVVTRIIQVVNDDAASANDMVNVIQRDPALAAKLLRVANSPIYGSRRGVETLQQAVVRLGQAATQNLALSFSLVSALKMQSEGELDYAFYWRRCLLSASAAKYVAAKKRPADAEALFLASLMQDLGMMVLDKVFPATYRQLPFSQSDHARLVAHENQLCRATHPRVGAWMMEEWGFSERMQSAVAYSHSPLDLPAGDGEFVRCVALSARMADVLLADDNERDMSDLFAIASQWLALDKEDVAEIIQALVKTVPAFERMFDTLLLDQEKLELLTLMAREKLDELRADSPD